MLCSFPEFSFLFSPIGVSYRIEYKVHVSSCVAPQISTIQHNSYAMFQNEISNGRREGKISADTRTFERE